MEHGRFDPPHDFAECQRLLAELTAQNALLEQRLAAAQEALAAAERRATDLSHAFQQQQATVEALQAQLQNAAEQIALFKRALYGRRSERYTHSPDQKTLLDPETLGDEPAVEHCDLAASTTDGAAPAESPSARARAPRRKRFEFPQFLAKKTIEHTLPAEELPCSCCGRERTIVHRLTSRQIEFEPATGYLAENVRCVYACSHCCEGAAMQAADKPPTVNEKGLFGASALGWIANEKFSLHVPTYRLQESLYSMVGQWFSRDVLGESLRRCGDALWPLQSLIRRRLFGGDVLHVDETTLRMLAPGTGATALCYLWGYAGGRQSPYVTFDFREDRGREGPQALLAGYSGYLQSDGYSVYETLVQHSQGRLIDVACWAHARRKFDEACLVTGDPLAHEMLGWIQQLYDLEDRARDLSAEERKSLRGQLASPILARMHARLTSAAPGLRPKSKLAEAAGYALNRWHGLTRYVRDGRLSIDNNLIERLLRPVAIGRKNWLFVGSPRGGETVATLFSIVQSARRNLVSTLPYLVDILRVAPRLPADDLTAWEPLLPDVWLAAHPESKQAGREEEFRAAAQRRSRGRAARRMKTA